MPDFVFRLRRIERQNRNFLRECPRWSYYCLTVESNLFGEFSLVRTWGRIGQPSRTKIELHATEQDAQAAMIRGVRQKQRKGYA